MLTQFSSLCELHLLSWLRVRVAPDIPLLSVTDFRFIVERLLLAENSNTAASALG